MKKILFKALKIGGITLGSLLLLMFLLPILFPGFVSTKIKTWASHAIVGELNFSKARLSFFNHFPSLTLTLYDFSLKGSTPFPNDTLVSAKEVALGVNLSSIFSKSIDINEIYLTKGNIHVLVDEKGQANYNVYRSDTTTTTASTDTTGASLKISRIQIDGADLVYDDRSLPLNITCDNLNYLGKGNLAQDIFDLQSHIQVDTFDLDYNKQHYIGSKKLGADLVTRINTRSLSFIFEKNDLRINSLPVQLKGRFDFLPHGYSMDFRLNSEATNLHDILTALPPEYAGWLDSTDVRGAATMSAALTGTYDSTTMPDLSFNLTVRDGFIANAKAPKPVEHLFLNLESKVPGLKPDSFYINIDSVYFTLGQGYFGSVLRWKGLNDPVVYARVRTALDLADFDRAVGLAPYDLKGRFTLNLLADGRYATQVVRKGLRSLDTVVTSIPSFQMNAALDNGFVKYAKLPEGVSGIALRFDASCPTHDYHDIRFALDSLHAQVLSSVISGRLRAENTHGLSLDGGLHTVFHLGDVAKVYPLDSMQLAGDLAANVSVKGVYAPAEHRFPATTATLDLTGGRVQTKYYPRPIDNIQVSALVTNTTGTMKSLKVRLTPVSFRFEDQPFLVRASLSDFENMRYSIQSQGTIDIGRLYQVFARPGMDVKGLIRTNLSLKGLQSDATGGHYDRLNNSGTMELQEVALTSDMFPKPLLIHTGLFRFDQEKMHFDRFKATYGSSQFALDGYVSDVIGYATQPHAPLSGSFTLTSPSIAVDELMAFSGAPPAAAPQTPAAATASGVVLVPDNLALSLKATVGKVNYNGLVLDSVHGAIQLDSGKLTLRQLAFNIIGAPVTMDASYASQSPTKASFTYHINAQDFDVHRAYKEIKLFHDLASSAAKAEGVVSLDYQLSGNLDADMHPIMPSLKGGGTLSIADVKVHGLKIFGAVSKATGKDSVNNPHLSKVTMKSSIARNIITIERTRMKVLGFRPRFEGQVGFDGKLNLQFRLGLPPLGILGIPMTITGTEDNPQVHLRRERKGDELQGTDDEP
ncbi:MAG TPA: AsmA-like C-terminal region-containing protein [Dinghuibacter sp.]|uniref:AsmA family protein n=1 Tax=Dinghuibacter sp. TaxID=2024697 RepID=UPI002BA8E7E2|nr:AsmA-like C-terminal region-containing protein [Dinghuibacter sp.]HTJ13574.1 AsmA-like C-terminal region-containing protein [Dinghuibacter sp.]